MLPFSISARLALAILDEPCHIGNMHNTTEQPQTNLLADPHRLTITVSEAAEILGVAISTAHHHHNATGEIIPGVPVLRVGRRCLVPTAALRTALGLPEPVRT